MLFKKCTVRWIENATDTQVTRGLIQTISRGTISWCFIELQKQQKKPKGHYEDTGNVTAQLLC